ncbi:MATE family efflux transporter [bacterium SCSIO 12741]|nr:MATE family efflux transporter [bacterium SCSIO 12741]
MAADFLQDKTNKILLRMSIPISLGMISTILFQVVDTYFVGQLGTRELTALGFASTVYFLLVGLYIGVSVAVSIQVGRLAGEGQGSKAHRAALIGMAVSWVLSSLFSILGLFSIDPLFGLLGATPDLIEPIREYLIPMYLGLPILAIAMAGGAVLRSNGFVRSPEIIFGVGGIINVILDYVLIFGTGPFPEMGIQGVAVGTVVSWIVMLVLVLIYLVKSRLINFQGLFGTETGVLLKELLALAVPTGVTQLVGPFTLLYVTFLLGQETSEAVAAFGVAGRIETLMMIGIMAVCTASTPFIAQNLGAQKHERIDEAVIFGGKSAFYLGFLLMIVMVVAVGPIARIFSDDPAIIGYTKTYFYWVSLSYTFYGFYLITASIFNGLQMPKKAMRIVLVKTLGFTIPLGLIGAYFGVLGIFIGLALSNVAGGIYAAYLMRKQLKMVNSPLAQKNPVESYRDDLVSIASGVAALVKRKG